VAFSLRTLRHSGDGLADIGVGQIQIVGRARHALLRSKVGGVGTPTPIVVTGPAGSGKTTLAHQLAAAVGCPALCRDEIKEGMVASNPGHLAALGDPLTMRTYELFFEAIALFLKAEVTLVAEAAFQHSIWWRGLEPLTGLTTLRIIRCRAPDEVARVRQLARIAAQVTRTAHADTEHLSVARTFDAIHVDAPTLDVDTCDGWHPGLDVIAAFCRPRSLGSPQGPRADRPL
jgi:predicted kinase